MPIAAVQRLAKGSVGAQPNVSIGAADGWVTPTAGNLIVVAGSSDGLLSASPAMNPGPAVIDDNAVYLWWKISDGTESTITVSPNASTDTAIAVAEYSGVVAVSPTDGDNTASITGTSGTTTNIAPITLSAVGDIVIAIAGLGRVNGTSDPHPTAFSWSNGFTARVSANTGTTSGAFPRQYINFGDLFSGATGSISTAGSWTNPMLNRQHIIMAFKAATAAVTAPAGEASGTGSAPDAATAQAANAGGSTGTGTAPAAARLVRPNAGVASGSGSVPAGSTAQTAEAGPASGAGSAADASFSTVSDVTALADVASGSGVAPDAVESVEVAAAEAPGTGSAPEATASTVSSVTVSADPATGAGSAPEASEAIAPLAVEAVGSGAAANLATALSAATPPAAGVGFAPDAAADVAYPSFATLAGGAGAASAAEPALILLALTADGSGSAPDASAEVASNVRPFLDVESRGRASAPEPGRPETSGERGSRPVVSGVRW